MAQNDTIMEVCESPVIKKSHNCRTKYGHRCAYCECGFHEFSDSLNQLLSNEHEDIKKSIKLVKDYYENSFIFLKGNKCKLIFLN